MIWPHPQPIRGRINMPGNKNTEYTYIVAAACYVICPQIMPQREKSIKHIFCPVNMLKTLIQWSLTMNMPPLLANIYECPIILPAIQDNRIANYKAKDFCPQPLRDLALGYAFGHGLFYCNIGCPVNLSFLTLKFYRTVIIKMIVAITQKREKCCIFAESF